jgi:phage regulator Rha-like protein
MPRTANIVPVEIIENKILFIRGQKVMLDRDLAGLYEVSTSMLNQAVRRNIRRFPADFMFQLSNLEKEKVITICDNLKRLKYSPVNPYAFTEHGILMLSSVLNSERAVDVNIQIMRAFTKLREVLLSHKNLQRKIMEMEEKYDYQFKTVFDAIKKLLSSPQPEYSPAKKIGFLPSAERK